MIWLFSFFSDSKYKWYHTIFGDPWWLSGKESACQCRRCKFDPWVRKISWTRTWQPTLVFLLENPMDSAAWQATVHGGHKMSQTWLSNSVHFSCSVVSDSLQPHGLQQARPPCPSPTPGAYTNPCSIMLVMPSNHLILCCSLLLLPPIPASIRVFSALCIRWPKYWSFSFNISSSNEHSGLISLRMDRLDLLGVQGTLKSLLQHHGSKASILWCSAFFIVQLSHLYIYTWLLEKTQPWLDGTLLAK